MIPRPVRYGLAFLLLAAAMTYSLFAYARAGELRLYRSALAGCERDNLRQTRQNGILTSAEIERDALIQFAEDAAAARRNSGDAKLAARYDDIATGVRRQVQFGPLPLLNCKREVPHP